MKKCFLWAAALFTSLSLQHCQSPGSQSGGAAQEIPAGDLAAADMEEKLAKYKEVRLTADLSSLSGAHKQMIPLLIEAGKIMDRLFWYEAYGRKDSLLQLVEDPQLAKYIHINYGPWDRLEGNEPFVGGVGPKPPGANFYPADMTKAEFEAAELPGKTSLYTFIRRNEDGELVTIPYHEMFSEEVVEAAGLLEQAAELEPDPEFKRYLELRAEALLDDQYQESDLAWMDAKNNLVEVVIGPIESYEDQLFGYKASHEAFVLIKDQEWSDRLSRYAAFLPELQRNLPVAEKYKKEMPGTDADLNAYDVVYYAGDANAGSKTIAINLPNDEEVQLQKGTRRLQLKNAMRAKFDEILVPISEQLIVPEQREHITFDAFFANTMFHEVAHGLGIKNTLNGKGTVREALREYASALEEGKADVLGLYMITQLYEKGELRGSLKDYYTTFLASIFRSVRFGASSAHGKANMIRFNYFQERDAFSRDPETGYYKVNYEKMREAMNALSGEILVLQGEGDYPGVGRLIETYGSISPELQAGLDQLAEENIPVDVVFEQGVEILGL